MEQGAKPWVPKCQYSSGSSDQRRRVAPDPRNHDFTTERFEHGARREFAKLEIVTHLRVGPTIIARGHMEAGL
jgi:hypothetical protein